jgi:hypothetical protein
MAKVGELEVKVRHVAEDANPWWVSLYAIVDGHYFVNMGVGQTMEEALTKAEAGLRKRVGTQDLQLVLPDSFDSDDELPF